MAIDVGIFVDKFFPCDRAFRVEFFQEAKAHDEVHEVGIFEAGEGCLSDEAGRGNKSIFYRKIEEPLVHPDAEEGAIFCRGCRECFLKDCVSVADSLFQREEGGGVGCFQAPREDDIFSAAVEFLDGAVVNFPVHSIFFLL